MHRAIVRLAHKSLLKYCNEGKHHVWVLFFITGKTQGENMTTQ